MWWRSCRIIYLNTLRIRFFLFNVIDQNEKNRFEIRVDPGNRSRPDRVLLRACQGHTGEDVQNLLVRVTGQDVDEGVVGPMCAHGTSMANFHKIRASGYISRMSRTHSHWTLHDWDDGATSGMRKDAQVAIRLFVDRALDAGFTVERSANNVVLIRDDLPLHLCENVVDIKTGKILYFCDAVRKEVALPGGRWNILADGNASGTASLRTVMGKVELAPYSMVVAAQE